MNIEWIGTVADSAAAIMALFAVAISISGVIISKRFHTDSSKTSILEKQYNAFNELGMMRIEHHTLNHLFEVPENYAKTLLLVIDALNNPSKEKIAETTLKERALAMYTFQVFEHTHYQYLHSKKLEDNDRLEFLKEVLEYFTGRLLNNPRLLYFWSKKGGNLCVYFEQTTIDYYENNLLTKKDEILTSMDRNGPFKNIKPVNSELATPHKTFSDVE